MPAVGGGEEQGRQRGGVQGGGDLIFIQMEVGLEILSNYSPNVY